jgi:hypothetical protein
VSLSSIFIAYVFFFRLARSNLVTAWAVCSYVVGEFSTSRSSTPNDAKVL